METPSNPRAANNGTDNSSISSRVLLKACFAMNITHAYELNERSFNNDFHHIASQTVAQGAV
jgi:hypothetical protein